MWKMLFEIKISWLSVEVFFRCKKPTNLFDRKYTVKQIIKRSKISSDKSDTDQFGILEMHLSEREREIDWAPCDSRKIRGNSICRVWRGRAS